jgi:hypothetical protein
MCCDHFFSVIGAGCLSSEGLGEIQNHAWFSDVDWATVGQVDETGAETGRFFGRDFLDLKKRLFAKTGSGQTNVRKRKAMKH